MRWLRRRIVLTSPWCTLWRHDTNRDCKVFKLWPQWVITAHEFWATRRIARKFTIPFGTKRQVKA